MSPPLLGVRRMSNRPMPDLIVKKVKLDDLKTEEINQLTEKTPESKKLVDWYYYSILEDKISLEKKIKMENWICTLLAYDEGRKVLVSVGKG